MKRATFLSMALLILSTTGRTAGIYTYEKATTLAAATERVTLHFPTGSSKTVYLIGATIYSSVATTYTVERDGTAPTTTAVTPGELNSGTAGLIIAYHTSNVGAGTTIKTYNIAASEEQRIELGYKTLKAGKNLTIRTASMTGNVRIFLQWREE